MLATASSAVNNQSISLYSHLLTLPVSSYVTEGIAKIYGFEVLRHGTSFPNYLNILRAGTDPNKGGSTVNFGEECDQTDSVYRRFHLFKDSDNKLCNRFSIIGHIFKRVMPRIHAAISGVSYVIANSTSKIVRVVGGFFSCIIHLFLSPTLRFVYRKEELSQFFENDPDYGNLAFRTHPNIRLPNDRIGLVGLCRNVTKEDAQRAWRENPFQVVIGAIQLFVGTIFTMCGVGILL